MGKFENEEKLSKHKSTGFCKTTPFEKAKKDPQKPKLKHSSIWPHRIQGVFTTKGQYSQQTLLTKNLVSGESLYNEKRISIEIQGEKAQYRVWNPYKSKTAASIIKGIFEIGLLQGHKVLYLGAGPGATVSHISDIIGPKGLVYAVENSQILGKYLVDMAKKRANIIPILQDPRKPQEYGCLVDQVDFVIADLDQSDQESIIQSNCDKYLKNGGKFLISQYHNFSNSRNYKANVLINKQLSEQQIKIKIPKLNKNDFTIKESVPLEPYYQNHILVRGIYRQNIQFLPKLRLLEEKAYLASRIIQEISSAESLQKIYYLDRKEYLLKSEQILEKVKKSTLTLRLLEMIQIQKNHYNLSQKAAEQMKAFFTTGVGYDKNVFCQGRILSSSVYEKQSHNPKFIFCPTYSVTGVAFMMIRNYYGQNRFIKGHYGISKTISFMLYSLLSNIICEFRFKTFDKSDKQFPLKSLIKNYPKLIYVTPLLYGEISALHEMRRVVLGQCKSQLNQQMLQKSLLFNNGRLQEGFKIIKQVYKQKDIKVQVVIDQIERFLAFNRQKQILKDKDPTNQIIKQNQKQNYNFFSFLQSILYQVGKIIFVSSASPPISLEAYEQLKYYMGDRRQLMQLEIQYTHLYQKQIWPYQVIDLFLFFAQQQLKFDFQKMQKHKNLELNQGNSINQQQKQYYKCRNFLVEMLKKLEGKCILGSEEMRQAIKKSIGRYTNQFKLMISKSDTIGLKICFRSLLLTVIEQQKYQLKYRIYTFFQNQSNKTDYQKRLHIIKTKLHNTACKAQKNCLFKFKKFLIDFAQSDFLPGEPYHQLYLSSQFFQIKEFRGFKAYCHLPPSILADILEPCMAQSFTYIVNNKMFLSLQYMDRASFGKFIEGAFIDMVSQLQVSIRLDLECDLIQFNNNSLIRYAFRQISQQTNLSLIDQEELIINNNGSLDNKHNETLSTNISLQKKNGKSFNFKKSFEKFFSTVLRKLIQKRYSNFYEVDEPFPYQHTFIFTPLKGSGIENQETQFDQLYQNSSDQFWTKFRKSNNRSKCVNFILMNVNLTRRTNPIITFNAFDIVISAKQAQDKIKSFLKEFYCFSDNNENKIEIQTQNGTVKASAKMNYFVLGPGGYCRNLKQRLQRDFQNQYYFDSDGLDSLCQVKLKNQKKNLPFLEYVGYLKIGSRCIVKKVQKQSNWKQTPFQFWKNIQSYLSQVGHKF